MKRNLNKLQSFCHGEIRCILHIKLHQVREKHVKNREVRAMFYNIPNVDAFINKRVAKYIGKTERYNDTSLPKKFLANVDAFINKE